MAAKSKGKARKGGGVTVSLTYNGKLFKGIDQKVAKKQLRIAIKEIGSGDGPLLQHYSEGQSLWDPDDPEYAKWKKKWYGNTEKFKMTGDAFAALKAKTHKNKKYGVSYRKKSGTFLMTATIRKMEDGRNVYMIAQKGRFEGIAGTSGGEVKAILKDDLFDDLAKADKMHEELTASGTKVNKAKFKRQILGKKHKFDKGSVKRVSRNERLITVNLPGDQVSQSELNKHIEAIIKASGYKIK